MNKTTLQKITELSSFVFEESDYKYFISLIHRNKLNRARIFLNEKLEEVELEICFDDTNEVLLSQYKMTNELEDIVMSLIINERETMGEGKVRQVTI